MKTRNYLLIILWAVSVFLILMLISQRASAFVDYSTGTSSLVSVPNDGSAMIIYTGVPLGCSTERTVTLTVNGVTVSQNQFESGTSENNTVTLIYGFEATTTDYLLDNTVGCGTLNEEKFLFFQGDISSGSSSGLTLISSNSMNGTTTCSETNGDYVCVSEGYNFDPGVSIMLGAILTFMITFWFIGLVRGRNKYGIT